MGHKFGVSRIQRGDGLAMFWKQDIDLKVVDSSPKPWRFEQVWLGKIGCHEAVLAAWQSSYTGSHMEGVVEKVSRCQNKLQSWSKLCFGNITKTLNEKRAALKRAETEALKGDGYESVYTLKKEITELLSKEEKLWQQ